MVDPNQLLLLLVVVFFARVFLAFIPLMKRRPGERVLHVMVGISAGLLIGVVLLDIFPEALQIGIEYGMDARVVPVSTATGFFLLLLIERYLISREEGGHFHVEDGTKIQPYGTLAFSALTVHGVMDGAVIPFGLAAGGVVGAIVTFAIIVHQIPDSFAALSVGLSSKSSNRRVALYVLVTAFGTPIGITLAALILNLLPTFLPVGLGFSAGTFFFVSAADLVPELQHKARSKMVTASIFLGFVLILAISMIFVE